MECITKYYFQGVYHKILFPGSVSGNAIPRDHIRKYHPRPMDDISWYFPLLRGVYWKILFLKSCSSIPSLLPRIMGIYIDIKYLCSAMNIDIMWHFLVLSLNDDKCDTKDCAASKNFGRNPKSKSKSYGCWFPRTGFPCCHCFKASNFISRQLQGKTPPIVFEHCSPLPHPKSCPIMFNMIQPKITPPPPPPHWYTMQFLSEENPFLVHSPEWGNVTRKC